MKVLFLVSDANARGGTEILAFNLLDKLTEAGVECYLLSRWQYEGNDPRVLSLPDADFRKWVRLNSNPLNKLLGNAFSDRYFKKVMARMASELQVDWVVNHTYDLIGAVPTGQAYKSAQIFNWSVSGYEANLKSAVLRKSFAGRLSSAPALSALIRRWHQSIPMMDKLIVLSETAHPEMKDVSPLVRDTQLVTIPDPLMHTVPSVNVSSLDNKTVVFVGRLSQEKGVMRLLTIWKRIRRELPDYQLHIYGEGHMKGEMENWLRVEGLAVRDTVEFKGFSKDLEQIYTNADLCLMTSDTEGFGMVLIEAMYYGVPCISFDCPVSPKEIIADAGVTVHCFDEEAYAKAVVSLLKDRERMKQLQANAINRAKDFYIDKVVDKWVRLLNSKD